MLKKLYYKLVMLMFKKEAHKDLKHQPIKGIEPIESIYDTNFKSLGGQTIRLSDFKGKFLLLTNTASACGYTPQYKELQALQDKYSEQLVVIGFPADNFGAQEPLPNEEIGSFCEKNYGVKFILSQKIEAIGKNQDPIFKWLSKKDKNGWNNIGPKWNFTKYLVSPKGFLLGSFPSAIKPMSKEITKFF